MRVYVETTVWWFAVADDSPDLTAQTLEFLAACEAGARLSGHRTRLIITTPSEVLYGDETA